VIKHGQLDPQELRFSLLFWDKLDYPVNSMFLFDLDNDSQFLESAGILQRTIIDFSSFSGNISGAFRDAHVGAYRALDRAEPEVWSLATGPRSFTFLSQELEDKRGTLVRLHHAIPVPDKDIALQEILEFKEKRRPELLALRSTLEQIYQRLLNAGDGPLALNAEISALQSAIADQVKASRSSGLPFRWSDLEASINVAPAAVAAIAAYSTGIPLPQALLTGATTALATLELNVTAALRGGRRQVTPYQYVSSYHEELFQGP
jgi:hypothetical protein